MQIAVNCLYSIHKSDMQISHYSNYMNPTPNQISIQMRQLLIANHQYLMNERNYFG